MHNTMRFSLIFTLVFLGTLPTAADSDPIPPSITTAPLRVDQVVNNLIARDRERANALRHYECNRVYRLAYRGFPGDRDAEMTVQALSLIHIYVTLLSRIIERGLVKDGRLVRLRVHLPDYPGALNRLTSILAQHRANIVETDYDRAYHGVGLGETAIEITMETRGPDHIAEIISALGAAGYTQERVL